MKKVLLFLLVFLSINVKVYALEEDLFKVDFEKDILKSQEWKDCNGDTNYSCRSTIIGQHLTVNNDRVYFYKMYTDGDETKPKYYLYYDNVYPNSSTVQNGTDKRALAQDEYFTISIKNLNINTANYKDIRVDVDYTFLATSGSILKNNAFEVYLVDQNNTTWGPYKMDDYYFNGYYQRDNYINYLRGFNIVTENLNKNKNITIKEIKIVPYGNVPKLCTESTALENGDWLCQREFLFSSIIVKGYKDSSYSNPNISLKQIDVEETRLNTIRRMYDIATIKWTPAHTMNSTHGVGKINFRSTLYEKGSYYYGTPYTQINRVPVEKFKNVLDSDNKLPYFADKNVNGEDVQSINNYGSDCSSSVFTSVAKFSPLTDLYNTTDYILDRRKTTLLGDLEIDGKLGSSDTVYTSLVNKYTGSTSTVEENFENNVKHNIRSNDKRVWYLVNLGDDGYFYPQLGYTNMESTSEITALDSGTNLTLTASELNINANTDVSINLKYIVDEKQTSNVFLDSSVLEIYGCSSDNSCVLFTNITANNEYKTIKTYENGKKVIMGSITGSINRDKAITYIKLLPYGTAAKHGEVFRFYELDILVSDTKYLNVNAGKIITYLNVMANPGTVLNTDQTNLVNDQLTAAQIKTIYSKYQASQDIYKGYAELLIGDIISEHAYNNTHVRLISGSTHVVCLDDTTLSLDKSSKIPKLSGSCDSHGGIDASRSYVIRTDISSVHPSSSYDDRNNYGGLINSNDVVTSWTPNSSYTDITKFSDLKDKNLDYFIDKKTSFDELNIAAYLPIRLNDYISGKTEKPYVTYLNGNTLDDIKNGYKGSVYSNYPIISVTYLVKDNDTNTTKKITDYLNHDYELSGTNTSTEHAGYIYSAAKRSVFYNTYSLYYNASEDVQNALKNTIKDSKNFEVLVTLDVGADANLEVLHLTSVANNATEEVKEESAETADNKIENPQTGSKIPAVLLMLVTGGCITACLVNRKKDVIRKI